VLVDHLEREYSGLENCPNYLQNGHALFLMGKLGAWGAAAYLEGDLKDVDDNLLDETKSAMPHNMAAESVMGIFGSL
jgi:hypothetical protein